MVNNNLEIRITKYLNTTVIFLIALVVGNALLLANAGAFLRVLGAMILLLLPGLTWVERLALGQDRLIRSVVGLGLSYVLIVIAGLLLHYLPGPTSLWMILLALNLLSLAGLVAPREAPALAGDDLPARPRRVYLLLLAILLGGALLRFYGLGYSEFSADEIKPLISAAESLEGREDALFVNRKKGPGEIIMPVMQWRLTGTVNELISRLPFALAGVLSILTVYLVAQKLLADSAAALVAAALLALNGFMLGFSRILQYQQIVIWMSLLALLCFWQWRQTEHARWGMLGAAFLGVGILFHYDIILITPALAYIILSSPQFARAHWKALFVAAAIVVAIAALFVVPFAANPQSTFTAGYVGGRIGGHLLNNNLFDFFHYTTFYNSFYYVMITGALVLGFLAGAVTNTRGLRHLGPARHLLTALLVVAAIVLSLFPDAFYVSTIGVDLAFIPFALLLGGAFLSPAIGLGEKTVIVWLATTFLGYNFIVADPRTHFYSVSPAWVMLAAIGAGWLWRRLAAIHSLAPVGVAACLAALFSGYLYIAFLRQDVEFRGEWPGSQPALYWSPYSKIPRHHFGFVRTVGWKAVGGLYATGQLDGRFATNSGSGLYRWYSRQALWGCVCCRPKKYYLAFNYKDIHDDLSGDYALAGQIQLPKNGRQVAVFQTLPASDPVFPPDVETLYQAFDRSATPAAFVWPRGEQVETAENFADLFTLLGDQIVLPQPHPGEELAVVLQWQRGVDYQPFNFNVLVQLADAEGNVVAQSDSAPDCGRQHTSTWLEDTIIEDAHILPLNSDTPPGDYTVSVGIYLPEENFRLPIFDAQGQPTSEMITLGTVTIE